LLKCPEKTYIYTELPSGDLFCISCDYPCELCTGRNNCSQCATDFYRNVEENWSEGECLSRCPEGKYPDSDSGICKSCDVSCSNCYGPTSRHCRECSIEYSKDQEGRCIRKQCSEGTHVANIDNMLICLPCDHRCLRCSDLESCIECKDGYLLVEEEGKKICKTCGEINSGYYTDDNNNCKGINWVI